MSPRRFVQILLLALCLLWTANLQAQESIIPDEIENSKYQVVGLINSNAVHVRSGPSENDYPTTKLDKDAEVTVVGRRYDWLKIVPPEGSFCYVAKAFVDRRANGTVGRVTSTLNVRIGSQLNELKAKIATKLEPGADVEIVGEEQEYFKIKPPASVHFYVNKQFVDPVRPLNATAEGQEPARDEQPVAQDDTDASDPTMPVEQDKPAVAQDDRPSETPAEDVATPSVIDKAALAEKTPATPTTQPTVHAEAEFERLETQYADASLRPLDEQPVAEMLEGYQRLTNSSDLPESLRRIAEFKSEVLKYRLAAKSDLTDTQKLMDDMKQKQMALTAEKGELEQRIKDAEIEFYTAVGTLRPSSLQQGSETLYRLTDPSNGRTVVYLRSDDGKIAGMIGAFIGVKGELQTDPQLNIRIITPTAAENVNPAKVGQSVAAQIVPPSLLPGGTTAQME